MNGAIGSVSLKDCCDKCADDEACKQDKNGCECWKPASVSNTQEMKNTKSISVRYPTFTDAMNGAIGSVSLEDCCDKCADDEACKQDKNGCECWKPASISNTQETKKIDTADRGTLVGNPGEKISEISALNLQSEQVSSKGSRENA